MKSNIEFFIVIIVVSFSVIANTSYAGTTTLTWKGELLYQKFDDNGVPTTQVDLGPLFNVGDISGYNTGTRTKDSGPQVLFWNSPLGVVIIPYGCSTCLFG